ncbi:MAG: hypothetical protein ACI4WS_00930 [Oscillospiraceae bacterium]
MSMEFYSESKHRSRKKRFCELCGRVINAGDYYYSERGKFEGEFFSRDMHVHCHNIEQEFCNEVDNEFSWDQITDYIQDNYCTNCENWEERDCFVTECPKIIELFSDKEV